MSVLPLRNTSIPQTATASVTSDVVKASQVQMQFVPRPSQQGRHIEVLQLLPVSETAQLCRLKSSLKITQLVLELQPHAWSETYP